MNSPPRRFVIRMLKVLGVLAAVLLTLFAIVIVAATIEDNRVRREEAAAARRSAVAITWGQLQELHLYRRIYGDELGPRVEPADLSAQARKEYCQYLRGAKGPYVGQPLIELQVCQGPLRNVTRDSGLGFGSSYTYWADTTCRIQSPDAPCDVTVYAIHETKVASWETTSSDKLSR